MPIRQFPLCTIKFLEATFLQKRIGPNSQLASHLTPLPVTAVIWHASIHRETDYNVGSTTIALAWNLIRRVSAQCVMLQLRASLFLWVSSGGNTLMLGGFFD